MNELLARIHPFRNDPNGRVALQHFTLHEGFNFTTAERDLPHCPVLAKEVGRGNVTPLLNRPELADEIDADAFAAKKTKLRDRIAGVTLQMEVVDRDRSEQVDLALKAFELSQAFGEKWLAAGFAEAESVGTGLFGLPLGRRKALPRNK